MIIYTVKPGDTVFSIAEENGTTAQRIITDNRLTAPGNLVVGQTLVLQYPESVYTVQSGDTLSSIADAYSVSVQELLRNNPILQGKTDIFEGQTIVISYGGAPLGNIRINGYAYPYISDEQIRSVLPYLTYLSIFSYGINNDGTLIPPEGGDERLIALAKEYDTVPLMMLTSLSEDGTFSNELVNKVLSDKSFRESVIRSAAEIVRSKGYGGIDVDFEFISPEYAEEFASFVTEINDELRGDYAVFVALAPKTSRDQRGLLYEAHDYRALGNAADYAFLMTYEWGYQFGPPLPVSPLNEVRRVAEFAVTEITPDKLFLGIPAYGYDWTLPYIRGESQASPAPPVAAVELARKVGAAIQFDEVAAAPYFSYYSDGAEHVVWTQDARSVDALARLAAEFGMKGVGIWNVMRPFPQMWLVLNKLFQIEKM